MKDWAEQNESEKDVNRNVAIKNIIYKCRKIGKNLHELMFVRVHSKFRFDDFALEWKL